MASALIVISLSLQGLATSRLLCPPESIGWLAPLRVACPPALWPFTDYPMFSAPHRRGDSLAWVDAELEIPGRTRRRIGRFEVRIEAAGEDWGAAFEREERRLRAELERVVAYAPPLAVLAFQRHLRLLSERGFVAPDESGRKDGQ